MADDLVIAPGVVIPEAELSWSAVRSGGPGGQNVNKVATKVELVFDLPATSALTPAVVARLRRLAASRLDSEGRVVVTSQVTRSQARNLEDARQRLAELVRAALVVPKKRRPTRPSKAAKRRRLDSKAQGLGEEEGASAGARRLSSARLFATDLVLPLGARDAHVKVVVVGARVLRLLEQLGRFSNVLLVAAMLRAVAE